MRRADELTKLRAEKAALTRRIAALVADILAAGDFEGQDYIACMRAGPEYVTVDDVRLFCGPELAKVLIQTGREWLATRKR